MKKIKYSIFTVVLSGALLSSAMLFTSCESDEETSCDQANLTKLLEVSGDKAQAYASDPTAENCKAYKEAMQNFINAADNCPGVDAQVKQLQTVLNELDCK